MKDFKFEQDAQEKDALQLLKHQHKKLAKQQVVFAAVFLTGLIFLILYIVSRSVYTFYDGYISLDKNDIRAVEDIYILDMKASVGDSVQKGDTLFSYVIIDHLGDLNNINTEPPFVQRANDMKTQAMLARQSIPVLKEQLRQLQLQLKSERNDIFYGLTNNTKQNDLKAQIAETQAKIREAENRVRVYLRRESDSRLELFRAGLESRSVNAMPYSPYGNHYTGELLNYACAPESGFIASIHFTNYSVAIKGEDILTMKYRNIDQAHFHIMTYVPVDKARALLRSDSVEVIVDSRTRFNAHLVRMGLGVQQLPDYLMNNFSRDAMVIMAALNVYKGQKIPYWVLNDNLPVKIRVSNISRSKAGKDGEGPYSSFSIGEQNDKPKNTDKNKRQGL